MKQILMIRLVRVFIAVSLLIIAGCSGGGGSDSVSDNSGGTYSATIGLDGGVVEVNDKQSDLFGISVAVPEDVVETETTFTITNPASDVSFSTDYTDITEQFTVSCDFDLHGFVLITCPLISGIDEDDLIIISYYNKETGMQGILPVVHIDPAMGQLSFLTDHFTIFKGQKVSDFNTIPEEKITAFNIETDCFYEEYVNESEKSVGTANYALWYYFNHGDGLRCAWNAAHVGEIVSSAWDILDSRKGMFTHWEIFENAHSSFENYLTDGRGSLSTIITKLLEGKPEVLNMLIRGSESGHCVVVTGYKKITASQFELYGYDVNYPSQILTVNCYKNSGSWEFEYFGLSESPYNYDFYWFYPQYNGNEVHSDFEVILSTHLPKDNWCNDSDGDGVVDSRDLCPNTASEESVDDVGCPVLSDTDNDGVADTLDNCPNASNADQTDSDNDGIGNACDICTDTDNDGFGNPGYPANTCIDDNCPDISNPDQADTDEDGIGDACDESPQTDSDGDGVLDTEDLCPDTPPGKIVDSDGCPVSQDSDEDGDGVIDSEDLCPNTPSGKTVDTVGCPVVVDTDNDSIDDSIDNCPNASNADQTDSDNDGIGDACDTCTDTDNDGFGDPGFPANTCIDDNCPNISNPDQADTDENGIGDACDESPQLDSDGDGVADVNDLCPSTPPGETVDSDGCPVIADADNDGVTDASDNCPTASNADQTDSDNDGIGDACDTCTDTDNDGFGDPGFPANTCIDDNCPDIPNPDQADTDENGIGDACDESPQLDSDGDGVFDVNDLCPNTPPGETVDSDGCTVSQDSDGDGVPDVSDLCPNTAPGETVDAVGCPVSNDSDGDGVLDADDLCPGTAPGVNVDADGCPLSQDSDGDGVPDADDDCPGTAPGQTVDTHGCPV